MGSPDTGPQETINGRNGTSKRRACVECRQQKLRCDASQASRKPCSRCRRFGIECEFSETFQRRKRNTKAQMQREIDELRKQVNVQQNDPSPVNIEVPSPSSLTNAPSVAAISNASDPSATITVAHGAPISFSESYHAFTEPLKLEGPELKQHRVIDCFNLFFQHYHQYLPILDPNLTPHEYFAFSPFLFWAIVAVGSRRYAQDPTILGQLAPKVTTMALLSAPRIQNHIQTIQGLLLICNWPFPNETIYDDPTMVFSGIIMQLAVQNGLHMTGRRLDFVRAPFTPDENQECFRARLWVHCKVVCQNTNLFTGLPPHVVPDFVEFEPLEKVMRLLRPSEFHRHFVQKTLVNAVTTLMNNVADNKCLSALIDVFDSQLVDNIRASVGNLNAIYLATARLHIRAFHFFDLDQATNPTKLTELHELAISFIDTAMGMDQLESFVLHSPEAFYRTLSLACCILLRISRSLLRERVDLATGETAYFTAINLFKRRSIQNNDLNSRSAAIMTQLWQSQWVFKKADGTVDSLHVRVCNRGSMGIVYDCLWYVRQEFDGIPDPYSEAPRSTQMHPDAGFNSLDPLLNCAQTDSTVSAMADGQFPLMTDINTFLPEWEWFFTTADYPVES